MRKIFLFFSVLLIAAALMAAPLKVAFIYVAPVGDGGWSTMHNAGRLHVEEVFGDQVVTDFIESVPEGAEAEVVCRGYAQRGYDLVFGTRFGYMDSMVKVAQAFPALFGHIIQMHGSMPDDAGGTRSEQDRRSALRQ